MVKSVLMSIQPQWCELIASGEKKYEVRKTRPKIDTPFRCYIFCTMDGDRNGYQFFVKTASGNKGICTGRVIGEFVCDEIIEWHEDEKPPVPLIKTCLSYSQIREYWGGKEKIYLWHISDLVIYDEPKELSKFINSKSTLTFNDSGKLVYSGLRRPPQSWCYVESEVDNE